MKEIFPSVFSEGQRLFTVNLIPGNSQYAKSLKKVGGKEYREWDPCHSKAAAAIAKGLKTFPINAGCKILYLGISNGTTASFFSDIIGKEGVIYGIEISDRSIRDLTVVAEQRGNIVPILANAKLPETYSWVERADIVYQDVAADDQAEILIRNCEAFLKPTGTALFALKSRSIDVTKKPEEVYRQEEAKLSNHFKIVEKLALDPFEKDHMFFVLKWKT